MWQSIQCPECFHTREIEEEENLLKTGDYIQCSWCDEIIIISVANTREFKENDQ